MAVTKIWDISRSFDAPIKYVENEEKTLNPKWSEKEQMLEDVIEYAAKEGKTENKFFVSTINCNKSFAREEFLITKKRFAKEGGIVAFHGYQSFEEGEVTPAEAHAIGMELANELWGDRFQVVVATHLNTKCLHNHFVINSVSFKDGKRYHDCRDTYALMRTTSDRICVEHGLSIINKPKGKGVNQYLYKMEQANMPTRYNVARQALDEAIALSLNKEEFAYEMRKRGYICKLNDNHKYWTITPPGWKQGIRTKNLGPEYTKERIMERVCGNDLSVRTERIRQTYRMPNNYNLKRRIDKIMGRSGIEKLYLRYCYELGYLPKYMQKATMLHQVLKEDLLKCERYSEEAKLLSKYHISTDGDILSFTSEGEKKIETMSERREELRKIVKRKIPEGAREKCKDEIKVLTSSIKEIRKELRLCEDISMRSEILEKNLMKVDKEQEKEVRNR
ncbi:MAG: relaxase/mobilization nuclease domain-containing protein [Clostridiales bacterium]|nr:relaxase/mobilization nuclease domain-containing protein [Clostridiales bacterium]